VTEFGSKCFSSHVMYFLEVDIISFDGGYAITLSKDMDGSK
jgi:hypothetical protein